MFYNNLSIDPRSGHDWRYTLYPPPRGATGPDASSAAAVARDVDSLMLPLLPGSHLARLIEEIDALAVVDASVQAACEFVAAELGPPVGEGDDDDDGDLMPVLWMIARDSLTPALVPAIRLLLRSGPTLIAATRWQLEGPMRSAVLRSATKELHSRRQQEPGLDARLSTAGQELAATMPEQKAAAAAVALVIVAEVAVAVAVADTVYHSSTGHHIWNDFHS